MEKCAAFFSVWLARPYNIGCWVDLDTTQPQWSFECIIMRTIVLGGYDHNQTPSPHEPENAVQLYLFMALIFEISVWELNDTLTALHPGYLKNGELYKNYTPWCNNDPIANASAVAQSKSFPSTSFWIRLSTCVFCSVGWTTCESNKILLQSHSQTQNNLNHFYITSGIQQWG